MSNEFDKVDTSALRSLKKSSNQSVNSNKPNPFDKIERESLARQSRSIQSELPSSSPRRTHDDNDLSDILKSWDDSEAVETEPSPIIRKGPIPFRLREEYQVKLSKVTGKGIGSKIKFLIDYHSNTHELLKNQISQILSLISQLENEMDGLKGVTSIAQVRAMDGHRINQLSREISLLCRLLQFDEKVYGSFLDKEQTRTLNFARSIAQK